MSATSTKKSTSKKAATKKAAKKKAVKKKVVKKKVVKKKAAKRTVTGKKAVSKKASKKKVVSAGTSAVKKAEEMPILPTKPDLSGTVTTPEARWQMIAVAAYHKAEKRDFAPGYELQDWTEAEKEIDILMYG